MPETAKRAADRQVELGSLVHQIREAAMPRSLPVSTKFVGLENIAPHEGQFFDLSNTSEVRSRVFGFQRGDVLYGRLRPYLRKAAVADFGGFASGEVIVLRCSEMILPRYLLTVLLSEDFTGFMSARTKGDRPRGSFASIATYRLELPPLEIQEEICTRDARVGNAVSKLGEVTASVDRVTERIMNQMRSKLIWDPDESDRVTLAELVESIDYGTTQRSLYGGNGAPVLRIPNITPSGRIDATDLKYAVLNQRELDRSRLKAGDILLVRSNGSLKLVGRAAEVTTDHENFSFAAYLLRIRPKANVLSEYLVQITRSDEFRQKVENASRSTTGINNLSGGRLAEFSVPIVGTRDQQRIVDILNQLQRCVTSSADNTRETWRYARALHEKLRSGWVGQVASPRYERTVETKPPQVVPDQVNGNGQRMQQDIQTIVLKKIGAAPDAQATFESIFEGLQVNYDEARDSVFKLLTAEPPILKQEFDRQSRSLVLRRSK